MGAVASKPALPDLADTWLSRGNNRPSCTTGTIPLQTSSKARPPRRLLHKATHETQTRREYNPRLSRLSGVLLILTRKDTIGTQRHVVVRHVPTSPCKHSRGLWCDKDMLARAKKCVHEPRASCIQLATGKEPQLKHSTFERAATTVAVNQTGSNTPERHANTCNATSGVPYTTETHVHFNSTQYLQRHGGCCCDETCCTPVSKCLRGLVQPSLSILGKWGSSGQFCSDRPKTSDLDVSDHLLSEAIEP